MRCPTCPVWWISRSARASARRGSRRPPGEEWEDFESGYQCDEEEWLATHAGHPEAARIAEQVVEHRSFWLRGYRGLLGQAYLTLVPVA